MFLMGRIYQVYRRRSGTWLSYSVSAAINKFLEPVSRHDQRLQAISRIPLWLSGSAVVFCSPHIGMLLADFSRHCGDKLRSRWRRSETNKINESWVRWTRPKSDISASPRAGWKAAEKFHCKAAHGRRTVDEQQKIRIKIPVKQKTRHTGFT